MSLALARKYRPKTFADVAVQSHVSNTLKGAIARGRVAHGYLLCGPRGTGKTTLARVLAMALNCERRAAHPDGEPCGECESCRRIWSGASSLDVVEIDAASNRSVDDARDLRERAMYAPSGEGRYKVYIVDEAHMLTREAWNALLKVLEEPPPRVVFVFCTTEPQKIAQAAAPILSRLQRFDLKRIGPGEIRARLAAVLDAEGIPFEPDALGAIARAADGGLRDALSLTDQVLSLGADARVTADRVRDALGLVPEEEYVAVLDLVAERRAGDVFARVARLAEGGVDFALFIAGLGDAMRALLALTLGGDAPDVSDRLRAALAARAARAGYLGAPDLVRMLQLLVEAEPRIRKSGQQQLLLETLLVRFALADRAVDLETVLRGLDGAPPPAAAQRAPAADAAMPTVVAPSAVTPSRVASAPTGAGRGSARPSANSSLRAAYETAVDEARPPAWHTEAPLPDHPDGPITAVLERPPVRTATRPVAAVASAPQTIEVTSVASPDVEMLAARWTAVVDAARAVRPLIATALAATRPVAVSAAGIVTVELLEPNDAFAQALTAAHDDVVGAIRHAHPAAARVVLRAGAPPQASASAAPQRLTVEGVRAERLVTLAQRDRVLGAAIEALDLELLD
ncbi:MAG TPA: DNA polymerase III subunit gamma/tau [Gemmatirosa sp.]